MSNILHRMKVLQEDSKIPEANKGQILIKIPQDRSNPILSNIEFRKTFIKFSFFFFSQLLSFFTIYAIFFQTHHNKILSVQCCIFKKLC